jgi:hypothetical protein
MKELIKLSKEKLEEVGRKYGIELDRRKSKKVMIKELEEVIDETIVEEEIEVIQPEIKEPQSFRSLRQAKKYAAENGGKVVERGKFYVL